MLVIDLIVKRYKVRIFSGDIIHNRLLDVYKRQQYDYISWWLYEAAPGYEVWTDDEKTKWCLKEPEVLYDFIRDECQG